MDDEPGRITFAVVFIVSMTLIITGVLLGWSWWVIGPLMGVLTIDMLWGMAETS